MVATSSTYDFTAIVDSLLTQKQLGGRHGAHITATIRRRALDLLSRTDMRYMPAFKILDLLAALTNIGSAIADATQLRAPEVDALLRESLSDSAPLIRQSMLEAALERARYEPLMLDHAAADAASARDLILHRRWAAMRAAHQEQAKLPDEWMDTIGHAVEHALTASDFRRFRHGPLLQLFAEMLELARGSYQRGEPLRALAAAIAQDGALWRRYALKSARFTEKTPLPADLRSLQTSSHTVH